LQFGARMTEEGPRFLFLGGIELFLSGDCHIWCSQDVIGWCATVVVQQKKAANLP
jgi:hypothetical protein